jgi:hypothetical protein
MRGTCSPIRNGMMRVPPIAVRAASIPECCAARADAAQIATVIAP